MIRGYDIQNNIIRCFMTHYLLTTNSFPQNHKNKLKAPHKGTWWWYHISSLSHQYFRVHQI